MSPQNVNSIEFEREILDIFNKIIIVCPYDTELYSSMISNLYGVWEKHHDIGMLF